MKKHRHISSKTDSSFFTSQFKLKSTEFPKQPRSRRMNTTLNSFKNHLLQQQTKRSVKEKTMTGRPVIQQIKFLTEKEDDFRLPKSITKRSRSKANEGDKPKIQFNQHEIFDKISQDPPCSSYPDGRYKSVALCMDYKKYRLPLGKNAIKQKVEKTALEKFKDLKSKENEENQNIVSQKNSQALYILLKSNRKNNPVQLQMSNEEINNKMVPAQPSKKRSNQASSDEANQKKREDLVRQEDSREVRSNQAPAIPKSKPFQAKKEDGQVIKKQVQRQSIIFKKVICQFDNEKKESFSQSDLASDSNQPSQQHQEIPLKLTEKSSLVPKKNKQQPSIESRNPYHNKGQQQKKHFVTQRSQKEIEKQIKKHQPVDIDIVPSANIIQKKGSNKSLKIIEQKLARQCTEREFLQLNNNKIEKILTTKYMDEQSKLKKYPIGPPPKLNSHPQMLKNQQRNQLNNENDEQLEEISFKHNQNDKQAVDKKAQEKSDPPKVESNKNIKDQTKPNQPQQGQQEQVLPLDQFIYYVQRIQDIGQYRLNSKDCYNDKSISKELIQIHKLCAYYMAHQFLYLAKTTTNLIKNEDFANGFYNLTQQELRDLKENGELENQLETIETNIEESKRLLKKSYEEAKPYLKKQEQILLLDGKTNFHIKCCSLLIKQFRQVFELYEKSKGNEELKKRCVYLIEIFCVLKALNGEQIKTYEDYEQIEDPVQHISTYRQMLLSR